MKKLMGIVGLLLALGGIGWFGSQSFDIQGLENIQVVPKGAPDGLADVSGPSPTRPDGRGTIRVASFNIQVFGESKLAKPQVVKVLHDAFKSASEDPENLKTLGQLDQPHWYKSSDDYAKWAAETFKAERATIERLGLLVK